ncbi:MAG: type 4a pilus biogenesis protein PilO [Rhodocyclaceae bacterium]|nr:type 4a pilus biogenesis protein PilO [Rhodocyclaceae bacterium]MCB1902318.1 type 4a pilus biogenesis protein PilO [Rhodocyclaceae bacterium]MCP5310895.1 type 4a pilus biogenesis protein PilO [Zoogloeaceae bacterium]
MWPLAPRIAVLAVVLVLTVVGAWWFDWSDQLDQLKSSEAAEQNLREEWMGKKRMAVNLDAHRQQLAEIDRQFGALLRQLPNKAEMDSLLADINQAGLGRGLQFDLFKPGSDVVRDFYAEMPITVKVVGAYRDLGAFISDVAKMPRIVTMQDIAIASDKDGRLMLDGKAVTYRYLDEDELAAQRKKAKEAREAKTK